MATVPLLGSSIDVTICSGRVTGCSDAWKDDPISARDFGRIGSHLDSYAKPLEGELDRADIPISEINNRQFHSTPLVLGTPSPSQRMASRSARPKALKHASVL